MGITIHFRGKLNSQDLIEPFCEEIEDIAKAMEWRYEMIHDKKNSKPTPLRGIIIVPHKKSEPLVFTFDTEGFLRNAFTIQFSGDEPDTTYYNHIKTQYAPLPVHIAIIKLLKYLNQKYLDNLTVLDEGGYWETEDESVLKEKMEFLQSKIDAVGRALDGLKVEKTDTDEILLKKIEKVLGKLFKK